MALKLSITTPYGYTAPEAYAKIQSFSGTQDFIDVVIYFYYNQAARDNNLPCIQTRNVPLSITNGASLEQMYTAVKLDDFFQDSIDC